MLTADDAVAAHFDGITGGHRQGDGIVVQYAPEQSRQRILLRFFVELQLSMAVAVFSSSVPGSAQQIRLNEFMAINRTGLLDEDGDTSDWLELYNPSSNGV